MLFYRLICPKTKGWRRMKSENISEKLVYKLDEISRIAKLDPNVIDNWEREFYFLQAGQTAAGHKIFRKKDLAIILRLKELIDTQGFTLAGAKRRIEEEFGLKSSTSVHSDRLRKALYDVREKLKDIADSLEKK
jgi:DNA-binding transcriptional MerR regulator